MAAAGAAASMRADPGVTAAAIDVGGTAPLTGEFAPAAAFVRGAGAYLAYVNSRGGVHGRSVVYRVVDDGGGPARTLDATAQLVERDGVFAVFGTVGTAPALGVRGYLEGAGAPHLFAASGATALGSEHRRYPGTVGFRPSHRAEGWIYGSYLARMRPAARVGVLLADDVDGRELLAGLRQAIARSRVRVVATERLGPAAPDVAAGVGALAAAGADVLALFVPARAAAAAFAAATAVAWRPQVLLAADATPASAMRRAPAGTLSFGWGKDPTEPRWRDDPSLSL